MSDAISVIQPIEVMKRLRANLSHNEYLFNGNKDRAVQLRIVARIRRPESQPHVGPIAARLQRKPEERLAMMKKLKEMKRVFLASAVLAVLIASPAAAQSSLIMRIQPFETCSTNCGELVGVTDAEVRRPAPFAQGRDMHGPRFH